MHKHHVFHCNIGLNSIFVSKSGTLKISEFGNSVVLKGDGIMDSVSVVPKFSSPEVCNLRIFTKGADIWSFGIVLYYLLFGKYQYMEEAVDDSLSQIIIGTDGKYKNLYHELESYSGNMAEAVKSALTFDHRKRPFATELLKIPKT